jgi:hypothetical protein
MKPIKISFYVYAEDEREAVELEDTLRAFVSDHRGQGVAVTAAALQGALTTFGRNFFVTQYLKNYANRAT